MTIQRPARREQRADLAHAGVQVDVLERLHVGDRVEPGRDRCGIDLLELGFDQRDVRPAHADVRRVRLVGCDADRPRARRVEPREQPAHSAAHVEHAFARTHALDEQRRIVSSIERFRSARLIDSASAGGRGK